MFRLDQREIYIAQLGTIEQLEGLFNTYDKDLWFARDYSGNTLLHYLVKVCQPGNFKLIGRKIAWCILHGASTQVINDELKTPIDLAFEAKNPNMLVLLLKYNHNITADYIQLTINQLIPQDRSKQMNLVDICEIEIFAKKITSMLCGCDIPDIEVTGIRNSDWNQYANYLANLPGQDGVIAEGLDSIRLLPLRVFTLVLSYIFMEANVYYRRLEFKDLPGSEYYLLNTIATIVSCDRLQQTRDLIARVPKEFIEPIITALAQGICHTILDLPTGGSLILSSGLKGYGVYQQFYCHSVKHILMFIHNYDQDCNIHRAVGAAS